MKAKLANIFKVRIERFTQCLEDYTMKNLHGLIFSKVLALAPKLVNNQKKNIPK